MLDYHGPSKIVAWKPSRWFKLHSLAAWQEQIRFLLDNKYRKWVGGESATTANDPPTGPDSGQKLLVIQSMLSAHTLKRGDQSQVGNVLVVTSRTGATSEG